LSSIASAYCRTHGCDPQKHDCEPPGDGGCVTEGPLLFWGSGCVSYDVHKAGSNLRGISYEEATAVVDAAFVQWLNADCGGGRVPSLRAENFGPVSCRKPEYNQGAGNANVFMFRDDGWPYENAIDTLALTTIIYNADTGEIYDADVEINTFQSDMVIGRVGRGEVDFESVITHEVGHFLGLSHSGVVGATMGSRYVPGGTHMATIEADDVDGVCAALEPSRVPRRDSCEPRHGFSAECAVNESGCQAAPGQAGWFGSTLVALGYAALTLSRRRPRRGALPGAKAPHPDPVRD
jgi:hypothetical protein